MNAAPGRLRVVIVGRPYDLSDARYDGFVDRRRPLLNALVERHDVSVALLRPSHDSADVFGALQGRVICDHPLQAVVETRLRRLTYMLSLLRRPDAWADQQRDLLAAVQRAEPDVVVTIGPWLDDVYAPLFARHRVVHLYEEDLTRMHELAPQSLQARAFRRVDTFVRAHTLAGPRVAIVISESELAGVRRRFPAAQSMALAYVLPATQWPQADTPSSGERLLVVGTLTQERHAVGLVEALEALRVQRPEGLRVRLISGAGLHPLLEPYREEDWVEAPGHVDELWPQYRTARMVLVPSKRATGLKTTILQGWATGCPVVTYAGAAATLSAHRDAMLVAGDGAGIARHIARAWDDDALRGELARRGRELMRSCFDEQTVVAEFLRVVERTAASA